LEEVELVLLTVFGGRAAGLVLRLFFLLEALVLLVFGLRRLGRLGLLPLPLCLGLRLHHGPLLFAEGGPEVRLLQGSFYLLLG